MTTDLETRLEAAFAERASATPIHAPERMSRCLLKSGGDPRLVRRRLERSWWVCHCSRPGGLRR
jgi:hypothetical protein